ncbi:HPP family protein [Gilliamella sp. B3464]|uniref:HPP family protein n=1 Tax=unclassified Gilliamella TaxID=2685620 RepID=UPI0022698546|nr:MULTISPECIES: HPP family protein [unclassified Gilliamella]MCX8711363.1 HPP family protein [Gilliamella sp. B3468]MCX8750736.1 HPP family protein [Gilliamella sp. B3464]
MKFFFWGSEKLPNRPKLLDLFQGLLGGTLAILTLEYLTIYSGSYFIMTPFGASCVILFAVSQSPLAQPRNVIFGHLISAFIGLVFLKLFGDSVFIAALAVSCAIAAMQFLRCVHPPAGANPLVILLTASQINYDFSFLLFPVLSGSVSLVIIAYVVNNLLSKNQWPIYWLAFFNNKKEK